MPRFHFNVYDRICVLDTEGTELPDWQAARLEAVRYAGALLVDEAQHVARGEDWRMEVTDEVGLMLFRLDFSVMASAATMDPRAPGTSKRP